VYTFQEKTYEKKEQMLEARRNCYFELLKAGSNSTQAAKAVGVSKRTAKVWRNGRSRNSGRNEAPVLAWYALGMNKPKEIDSYYLSQQDRIIIADSLIHGDSLRTIAARINKSASTISREVRRGYDCKTDRYNPYLAQQTSTKNLARPKMRKLEIHPRLRSIVQEKLNLKWSPEQISAWLKCNFSDNESMQISHESIYQALYVQAKGQLKRDVTSHLRTGRVARKAQGTKDRRGQRYKESGISIADRPLEVEDRAIPGHWEGDLIVGRGHKSAIGTLVERNTRYCILIHLPYRHDAFSMQTALIEKLKDLPDHLLKSLTWDQGSELALHRHISKELDMKIYFCDPRSPWQRGSNENTNGLLRQYFPKGTNLSIYSEEELDAVAFELNGRPRKTLEWDNPAQRFNHLIESA